MVSLKNKLILGTAGVLAIAGAIAVNKGETYTVPCQDKNAIFRGWREADKSMDEALYVFDRERYKYRLDRNPKHEFIGSYSIFGKSYEEVNDARHKRYELKVEIEGKSRDDDITDTLISAKLCPVQ